MRFLSLRMVSRNILYAYTRVNKVERRKREESLETDGRMRDVYICILERQRICSRHGYLLGGYIVYIQARNSPVGAHAISLPTLTVIIVINNKT